MYMKTLLNAFEIIDSDAKFRAWVKIIIKAFIDNFDEDLVDAIGYEDANTGKIIYGMFRVFVQVLLDVTPFYPSYDVDEYIDDVTKDIVYDYVLHPAFYELEN